MPDLTDLRRQAKDAGLRWADVLETYRELRRQQRYEREYDKEIRTMVWRAYQYTPDCEEFYWIGMQRRFPRAFEEGDRTIIPRFDEVADGLKYSFPEFDGDDPGEAVWNYLQRDVVRLPPAIETYGKALELVAAGHVAESVPETPDLPF